MKTPHGLIFFLMALVSLGAGCGDGGAGKVDGGELPDGEIACDPGTQDEDGDGVCLPDCGQLACVNGTCAITAGVAACACDPGYAGDDCADLDAPNASSVAFWLDAADAATIATNEGFVTSWSDKSGSAYSSLVDADEDTWPTLVDDAVNGLPVVRFDGNDGVHWNDVDALTNQDGYTLFMVVSAVLDQGTFLSGTDGGDNQMRVYTGEGTIEFVHDTGTPSGVASDLGWSHVEPHLVTLRRTTNRMSVWIDGRHRYDAPAADAAALSADLDLMLGGGSSGSLMGDVAELLIVDTAMEFTERRAIESYLGVKWLGEAPAIDPTSFAVTTLWLDASDEGSITETSGRVTGWANLGYAGGALDQDTYGDSRPARIAAGLGGHDVIRFDGDDFMWLNAGVELFAGNSYTMYAVLVPAASGGLMTPFVAAYDGVPTARLDVTPDDDEARFTHLPQNEQASEPDVIAAELGAPGEPIFVRMRRSGPSMTFTVDTSSSDTGARGSLFTADVTLTLGAESGPTPEAGFVGDVAEIVIMPDVLSNPDEQAATEWLRAKWGL